MNYSNRGSLISAAPHLGHLLSMQCLICMSDLWTECSESSQEIRKQERRGALSISPAFENLHDWDDQKGWTPLIEDKSCRAFTWERVQVESTWMTVGSWSPKKGQEIIFESGGSRAGAWCSPWAELCRLRSCCCPAEDPWQCQPGSTQEWDGTEGFQPCRMLDWPVWDSSWSHLLCRAAQSSPRHLCDAWLFSVAGPSCWQWGLLWQESRRAARSAGPSLGWAGELCNSSAGCWDCTNPSPQQGEHRVLLWVVCTQTGSAQLPKCRSEMPPAFRLLADCTSWTADQVGDVKLFTLRDPWTKLHWNKNTDRDEIPFFLSPGLPFHPSSREGTDWALAFGAEVTWVLPGQSNLTWFSLKAVLAGSFSCCLTTCFILSWTNANALSDWGVL